MASGALEQPNPLRMEGCPHALLITPDFDKLQQIIKEKGYTQDTKALRDLLDSPSQHIWITFQDGCMWWCTAFDGATVNPDGESSSKGHFWLVCDRPWSKFSLNDGLLAIADLPGAVTRTAGFQGTVCTPVAWQAILRIIRGDTDPDVIESRRARLEYQKAVYKLIKNLTWKDFEQLIDHILTRAGWVRISTVGKSTEAVDIEAQNLAVNEIAFVQVKSEADQSVLNDYTARFQQRREKYARMIFAVHSPAGVLTPTDPMVQVWQGEKIAEFVVRMGLGEWVETRLA